MTKIWDFPYPIYDLTKNLIPFYDLTLRLLGEWLLLLALNGVEEGKARLGEGRRDEKVASSKKKPNWRLECKKWYLFMTQMAANGYIDTQFTTKTAKKPYPLGPHIPT